MRQLVMRNLSQAILEKLNLSPEAQAELRRTMALRNSRRAGENQGPPPEPDFRVYNGA